MASTEALVGAEEESVSTEAPVPPAVREEVIMEGVLLIANEVGAAVEAPVVEIIDLEGGNSAEAHANVPSSSWAREAPDEVAEVPEDRASG